MKIIFTLIFSLYAIIVSGQEKDKSQQPITATFSGQVSLTTDGKGLFFNMGGPGLKMEITPKIAVSVNMFPSLRYEYSSTDADIKPFLGTGLQIYFKRFIVAAPFYYLPNTKNWVVTAGIGWKLK